MMNSQLRDFARSCVDYYSSHKNNADCYITVNDLPDFVKHEFAALIMCHDEAYAAESTGPDNKHWTNEMLPALIRYLRNSADKDEAIEFKDIWMDCVADHVSETMQELMDDAIEYLQFEI